MEKLILALMAWASAHTGLPVPTTTPTIIAADRCEIERLYFDDPNRECSDVMSIVAVYDHRIEAMFLPDTWAPDQLYDISVLLHELVHHMQAAAGITAETVGCVGAEIEKPAYDAQIAFLRAAGVKPLETMGINDLSYMMLTMCEDGFYPR